LANNQQQQLRENALPQATRGREEFEKFGFPFFVNVYNGFVADDFSDKADS